MRYTKRIEVLGDEFTSAGLVYLAGALDRSKGSVLRQLIKRELAELGILTLEDLQPKVAK